MSAVGKFEVPSGVIDGSNTVFVVSSAYAPSSVAVFINGQLKNRPLEDGWVETNPAAGVVTLAEPPRVGEVVQIFFIDAVGGSDTVEVSPLRGRLKEVDQLKGRWSAGPS